MEYKIAFPESRKKWTTDLDKVKEYAAALRTESPALYAGASMLVKTPTGVVTTDLEEWLLQNAPEVILTDTKQNDDETT